MATSTNGTTVRKSLESQLDRFDAILDGLADNLNEAVVMAVQHAVDQAVRGAVRDALREIVYDPTVVSVLRGMFAPSAPTAPVLAGEQTPTRARPASSCAAHVLFAQMRCSLTRWWRQACAWAGLLWQYRTYLLAALLVAALLGLACYWAGPVLCSAFLAGLLVSAGSVAVFLIWHRRQSTALFAEELDAVSPMPEQATSPTPADASASAL